MRMFSSVETYNSYNHEVLKFHSLRMLHEIQETSQYHQFLAALRGAKKCMCITGSLKLMVQSY